MFTGKRCQECNVLLSSHIYRCVSCVTRPSYDLCKRCFENDICFVSHQQCVFVSADINNSNSAVEWKVAQRPSSSNTIAGLNSNHILQYREFDASDYDTLLALDNEAGPPLHQHLIQTLHSVVDRNGDNHENGTIYCSICSSSCSQYESLKYLNCRSERHIAHETCIVGLLIEAQSTRTYGNVGAQCPTCQNKSWLFPMLVDDPIALKSMPISTSSAMSNNQKKKHQSQSKHDKVKHKLSKSKFALGGSGNKNGDDLCILG
jgi:hypothetical protein